MSTLYFDLSLRENLSKLLPKVGAASKSVFGGVDRDVKNTQKGLDGLGKGTKLTVDTSGLRDAGREVDNLSNKLKNIGGGRGGSGGGWDVFKGSFAGGLASRGVEKGFEAVKELGKSALEAGMDAEQQIIGLSTFVGKNRAKAIYDDLQKSSTMTPFTTSQILPGELQLIASGQTPEKAKKDLWSLMNALSGSGNAGNGFALELGESHLAQMAAVGKVDAYFMKEFQRTLHIPMTRLLAEQMFPKNVPGGMKQISAWTEGGELKDHVTYDMFVASLDKAGKAGGLFAGSLEAQSQTIKGKASTIKDWWNIGMAKTVLDPGTHANILKLEDRLISGLESFPDLIGKISPVVNKLFDEFNELWPSVREFGSGFLDLLKPLGSVLLSDGMKDFGKGLLDFATTIEQILLPPMKLLGSSVQWLVDQLPKGKEPISVGGADGAYFWNKANMDSMAKAGYVVDEKKQRAISDSLTKFGNVQVMPSYGAIDSFNRAQFAAGKGVKGQIQNNLGGLNVPFMKSANDASKLKDAGAESLDASNAIVGGGRKVVNINFRSFVEHMTNNYATGKEGVQNMERELKEMFVRILRSAEGAVN